MINKYVYGNIFLRTDGYSKMDINRHKTLFNINIVQNKCLYYR